MLDETVLQIEKVYTAPYKTFHPHPTQNRSEVCYIFMIQLYPRVHTNPVDRRECIYIAIKFVTEVSEWTSFRMIPMITNEEEIGRSQWNCCYQVKRRRRSASYGGWLIWGIDVNPIQNNTQVRVMINDPYEVLIWIQCRIIPICTDRLDRNSRVISFELNTIRFGVKDRWIGIILRPGRYSMILSNSGVHEDNTKMFWPP